MKKILRSRLIIALMCSMLLSSNALAEQDMDISEQVVETGQAVDVVVSKIDQEITDLEIQEDVEVRIVVELIDEPIIEKATTLGVKVEEMEKTVVQALEEDIVEEQMAVIEDIETDSISLDIHENFTNVLNGFSASVQYKDIDEIAANPLVKNVYLANKYEKFEPEMNSSNTLTGASYVYNNCGYTGAGIVISIIDTGIDPTHKDFVLDEEVVPKINEVGVSQCINDNGMPGKYFTEKVPYGYNYADENNEIIDLTTDNSAMHGMHVAGIAAANGTIKGVAPNAQVLAMKVFSNDATKPYTYSDLIIAAIDDSITLGADVMNLSLGITASSVDKNNPEQIAIKRSSDNGVIMSIAAGNSAYFGYGRYFKPFTTNPDIGVVDSPGLVEEAIQVGAVNNLCEIYTTYYSIDGLGNYGIGFGKDQWDNNITYEVVSIGGTKLGYPEDYDSIDVSGKVVLVKRGELTLEKKTKNAIDKGAMGIIVYNNEGDLRYNQGGWNIPFMMISDNAGEQLESLISENGGHIFLNLTDTDVEKDPTSGYVSEYSSWGTTPTMDLKPEISAPGTDIYSTLNNNEYGYMSGTSMAAPQIAGAAALLLEMMKDSDIFVEYQLQGINKTKLIKNILMNTASPVADNMNHSAYASPRVQGAGLLNLINATHTTVTMTDATTDTAKVNFGEFTSDNVSFDIKIKNYASLPRQYQFRGVLQTNQTEYMENDLTGEVLSAQYKYYLNGSQIEQIVVPANSELIITVEISGIDVNYIMENFPNGNFVEGYIFLQVENEDDIMNIPLSIPVIGFCGDWEAAEAFDRCIYEGISFYGSTALLHDNGEHYFFFGSTFNDEKHVIVISPNNDNDRDRITPMFSLLRNLKNISFEILDEHGAVVTTIGFVDELRKNYYDNGNGSSKYLSSQFTWDGKVNDRVVEDGNYYYQISGYLVDGVTLKTLRMPFSVDTVSPVIDGYNIDETTDIITVSGSDAGVGIQYYYLVNAKTGNCCYFSSYGIFEMDALFLDKPRNYKLYAVDYAHNVTCYSQEIETIDGHVVIMANSIYFENNNPISIQTNNTINLDIKAKLTNNQIIDITNDPKLTLTASNDNIIIDSNKSIKGVKAGTTKITATYESKTAEIVVNVTAPADNGNNNPPTLPPVDSGNNNTLPSVPTDGGNVYNPPNPVTPSNDTENIADEEAPMAAISSLIKKEAYIKGYADQIFKPEAFITRAEISEIFNRILILDGDSQLENFEDIDKKFWAYDSIINMQKAGLLTGYKDQTFKAGNYITKAEIATILSRAMDYIGLEVDIKNSKYTDISGNWAESSIKKIYSTGIFLDKDGTAFRPNDKLTRAETVALINKFIGLEVDVTQYTTPSFLDVTKQYWAYGDIEAAYIRK